MPLDWKFYVDWDGVGGLNLGSFEATQSVDAWGTRGTHLGVPVAIRDNTRSYDGSWSLKVTYPGLAAIQGVYTPLVGLTIGRSYTFSARVWVPSGVTGHFLNIFGTGFSSATSTVSNAWQNLACTFTPTSTVHEAFIGYWPGVAPPAGDQVWIDRVRVVPVGADVTSRVLAREPVSIAYGRDQARSLSPTGPARAALALNNTSRDYSPENTSSPLNGYVLPNRDMLIEATWNGKAYTLFRGKSDDFSILPGRTERAVSVTAVDALAAFREDEISTDLHVGITTGEAVHAILDAVGWPAHARDIDPGVTTIRYWWEEGADAGAALERVINSEGPPATAFVSSSGDFVFRDRHHRLTREASLTSQATLRDTAEPMFSQPLVYDQGWRDIVNSVTLSIDERTPSGDVEAVWTSDATCSIEDGETAIFRAEFSDPVISAVTPVAGVDYQLRSGTVEATLSRTTGASITIFLKAVGGPAVVDTLQLRASPVAVRSTRQIHAEDSESIRKHGRKSYPFDAPWANVNDAEAIAEVILAHRAERLPVVTFRVISGEGHPLRLTQALSRDLSDRVTLVDAETGLNADFFIDRIEHSISHGGKVLETTFSCEKAPAAPGNLFRFNAAGHGFNDGVFASIGRDEPDTMFRFDVAGQGFDDGVFAH